MEILNRVSPQSAGIDPVNLKKFYEAIGAPEYGVHSFVALRHGNVISEAYWTPYAEEKPHVLYSASKTFTGLSVGFAVQDGLLSLDDKVVSFFPERLPSKHCENMEKMRIRDLITMSTGFAKDPHDFDWPRPDDILATGPHCCHQGKELPRNDWVRNFFNHYVAYEPGTEFVYCTHGTFMMSVIVQKVTGKTVSEYMNEKLFKPLGIGEPFWESNPDGYTVGGWGLMLTAEQLAVVGQWMLNKGMWNGKQLLSAEWIEAASSVQIEIKNTHDDKIAGYGYQIWVGNQYGAYFFRGAFGQICAVVPGRDMVFAYMGGNNAAEREHIWNSINKYLLDPAVDEALPVDAAADEALAETVRSLNIPVQEGEASWDHAEAASYSGRKYQLGDNRLNFTSVQVDFAKKAGEADHFTLGLTGGRSFTIPVGYRTWLPGETCVADAETDTDVSLIFRSTSACAAWVGDRYVLKLCFDETNYTNTFELKFAGNAVIIKHSRNNTFYEAVNATLVGAAE